MLENYSSQNEEMILRDYLAVDRTALANERTLLAYLRTFIGAFSAGIAMVNFLESRLTTIMGIALVAVSPFILVIGIVRFFQVTRKIKSIDKKPSTTDAGPAKH